MIQSKKNPRIPTKNHDGKQNGFLIPIINVNEGFPSPDAWPKQVYCTVAYPGQVKGPHLHKKRAGLFTCIKGNVKIVIRIDGKYVEHFSGDDHEYATIQVPPGIPSALVNIGKEDAYILNMPSPAWSKDEPDDWDVSFEGYNFNA